MASHHYICCCEGGSCQGCEIKEDWCWSFYFKHRYEAILDGYGPTQVYEEEATFENVHMTWAEELQCYIAIGGTVSWKCEYKVWSWGCGNYANGTSRPCRGCDPFPCDVTTYEGTASMAGRARMCCVDPCNLPDPPCGQNAYPTSELDINVFGLGTYTLDNVHGGPECSCNGFGPDYIEDVPWAFQCKVYGKPGCFTAEGPGEKTFDRYSVMPWVLCDYDAPTPQSGIGVGYFTYTAIPICSGEYVLPYNCKGSACPLDVRYNIARDFGWTVESCNYVIDPVPGAYDYGICWTGFPIHSNTIIYDCGDVLRGRTYKYRHTLDTSMSTKPYPC